ncbi:polyamine transporter 1 [Histoplasma capsulatum]|uniref:Polyamine transporter 1 n=1 Tax=Ajellomyces capsulatus TaxID=5037 RepID=A0A8A1MLI0_AJECA|nr:polyamine transporter 1 [Histoplasma capsulatum]
MQPVLLDVLSGFEEAYDVLYCCQSKLRAQMVYLWQGKPMHVPKAERVVQQIAFEIFFWAPSRIEMPTNGELYSRPLSDGAINTDNLGNACYAKRNSTHAIVQPQQNGGVQAFGEGGGAWEVVLLPVTTNPIKRDDEDLEVHWDGPDDPANPRNFPPILRWSMVIIISLCSLCTYMAAARCTW